MKISGRTQETVKFRLGNNKAITKLPNLSKRSICISEIEFENADEISNIIQLLTVLLNEVIKY